MNTLVLGAEAKAQYMMKTIFNMTTLNQVLTLLNEVPLTRDNDELLTAIIWYNEANLDNSSIDAKSFLKMYSERKFTSAESIRRCRQKLQEETPGLRGRSYAQRHKKSRIS